MDKKKCGSNPKTGVYILPNLFTTASLFCGFYSILASSDKNFILAAILIFIAMIFDASDGRIARLTNTTSEFGVQYDSLCDLVSCRIAPAILAYKWALYLINDQFMLPEKFGWLAAFIYAACAALRLARFNCQVDEVDKDYFIGLPSPAAAGVIAGFVWFSDHFDFLPYNMSYIVALLLIICGILMICNLCYFSGKSLKLERKIPFIYAVIPIFIFAIVLHMPSLLLFLIFSAYSLHGIVLYLLKLRKK